MRSGYLRSRFRAPALLLGAVVAVLVALSSCGGGTSTPPPPPPPPPPTITSVIVTPTSANLYIRGTQQFNANVQGTGSFNPSVNWYVNDVQGGNSTAGTISTTGLYTAPSGVPNPSGVTVKAKSVQDTTKYGSSVVTVNPENIKISISPSSGSVQLGAALPFTATVTGTANTAVWWSVNTYIGGQPSVGFIDQNGNYTAPANLPPNPVTIAATSQEDNTKSAAAPVTILATAGGITVTISPQNPNVVFDGTQSIQFSAAVTGTANTAVAWSVDANFGAIGQITSTGLFTPLGFNCANVPPRGLIRAVSAANAAAQDVSEVNLIPPTPTITAISPQPADAQTVVQFSGTFALGANLTALYAGTNGAAIPGAIITEAPNSISGPVPLGASSGSVSIQQSCVSGETGLAYPVQQSNSLPFKRLSRLRVRANRQVLTPGESTQMLAAFMGDTTPQPITWSALFGSVTQTGVFTAGAGNWDKVTGCITGTQQCDYFVFSVVPARIDPTVPIVSTGGTIQLSEAPNGLSPAWSIEAGGGNINSSGLYTAPTVLEDSGAIPVTTGTASNAVSVVGAYPGMVNRIIDYPDISANGTGATTLPRNIFVDGNRVYVFSDNLPFGIGNMHYQWIDAYDATDPAHPLWTGAIEGFDQDSGLQPMHTFAGGGALWRVTPAEVFSPAGPGTTEVAYYDASSGQPVLKQIFGVPRWWVYNFYKGILIGVPASFNQYGQSVWQSPVTVTVFDSRTGMVIPYQISLAIPNPSAPFTIEGISFSDSRLFLLYQQQQSDGSLPFFLSTYDLTSSPPALLQTVPSQPTPVISVGPLAEPGGSLPAISGNHLYTGTGIYDISSGLPVYLAPLPAAGLPADTNGTLALYGPQTYELMDFTNLAAPKAVGLLYDGGDFFYGPGRFVGNHAYIIGSGLQIFDVSAPAGGAIPQTPLQGRGALSIVYDLLASPSTLFVAETTDVGGYITTFDITQTPRKRIGAFALANTEVPLALAAAENFLFVGTSTELLVLDVSNPASPTKIASLALPTSSLVAAGNLLYAGTTDNHLVVINVSSPSSPAVTTSLSIPGYPVFMRASGNLLFVAGDTAGLLTYSLANSSAPALLSQFKPSSAVEGVAIDGNLALLAAADGGFVIANMTNPAAPVLAGQVPLSFLSCYADTDPADGAPGLVSISLNNGIAYLGAANMYGRVFGFDYRQPAHPRLVSTSFYGNAILESVYAFAFFGSSMFVAGDLFNDQIYEADISQPRNFIRNMCLPPPFGSTSAATYAETAKSGLFPTKWNPKSVVLRNRFSSVSKPQ